MTLKLITAATESPVSLDELKLHCAITADTDNATLESKLAAATEWLAGDLGRAFITSTWELALPTFPIHHWSCPHWFIELPLGNLQSVDSITYRDSSGAVNSFTTYRAYRTYTPADPLANPIVPGDGTSDCGIGRVCPAYGVSWPSVTLDVGESVVIRFTCGWDSAASVPTPIKHAICMVAEHFRRNTSAVVTGMSASVSAEVALGVQRLTSRYEDKRW